MDLKHILLPLTLICATTIPVAQVLAASDSNQPGKHDTAKGAAAGALVGHEVGSGHAAAGAAAGAVIGHHEKTKAQEKAKTGSSG